MRLLLLCVIFSFSLHGRTETDAAMDELRLEISDLKHALHTYQVDLRIAEEKIRKQENTIKQQPKMIGLEDKILILEKKLVAIEKGYEKLSNHTTQIETKLSEVGKLKDTLISLSKNVKKEAAPIAVPVDKSYKTYKVKGGDNLEKIARIENTSIDTLKKVNHLETDKIFIGQILKVPE